MFIESSGSSSPPPGFEFVILSPFLSISNQILRYLNTSATINLQTSTGNELCFVTSQKQAIVRYINWICQTSEWNVEEEFLEVLFSGRNADERFESTHLLLMEHKVLVNWNLQASTAQKRTDRVDADLLFAVLCC